VISFIPPLKTLEVFHEHLTVSKDFLQVKNKIKTPLLTGF